MHLLSRVCAVHASNKLKNTSPWGSPRSFGTDISRRRAPIDVRVRKADKEIDRLSFSIVLISIIFGQVESVPKMVHFNLRKRTVHIQYSRLVIFRDMGILLTVTVRKYMYISHN